MRSIEAVEGALEGTPPQDSKAAARWLLSLAEEILEIWAAARGQEPARSEREGFRLLELHHQGAQNVPSFNACRETCREIAYHYNLLTAHAAPADAGQRVRMMVLLVRHLAFFVGGKLQVEGLGEFCCASRPLRQAPGTVPAQPENGDAHA